nr:MAG TPA: hypothetical protein [Caudoviricetes sp.]DAT85318.1 MAG TPA: hypothetical protein [Caudoviricetes sp.]DAW37098.1 MAG TPA: hypothetical protein [Caudoviricetes sp.]
MRKSFFVIKIAILPKKRTFYKRFVLRPLKAS